MRRVPKVACLAALVAGTCAVPASAQEEVIAPPTSAGAGGVVPLVDHFDGISVWSELETSGPDPRYFLTVFAAGQRARLPVAPRSVPFDVDLGPDADDNVVAVYSRCTQEPADPSGAQRAADRIFSAPHPAYTTGRGCDLYRYDFRAAQEEKIEGASTGQASEVLPSVWKDEIAFARVYERRAGNRGIYPYLYVRSLTEKAHSRRQPGGSRGISGLPGPTSLDLYGRRLSFTWNHATDNAPARGTTELRLDTVDGDHEVLSQADFNFSNGRYATYLSPAGSRGRIFYGYHREQIGSARPSVSITDLRLRHRLSDRERSLAQAPGFFTGAVTDGETTILGTLRGNGETYFTEGPIGEVLRRADAFGD